MQSQRSSITRKICFRHLGSVAYEQTEHMQKDLQRQRMSDEIEDTVLFLEHPAVITLGTRGSKNVVLLPTETQKKHNVPVLITDRGGQVTLHAPGQLVGYFIFKLSPQLGSLRRFLANMEQSLLLLLERLGLHAKKSQSNVGIWIEQRKIASIGVCVNNRVTRHGFALNINNDLSQFGWIVPCGLSNLQVTSVAQELAAPQDMSTIESLLEEAICKSFAPS